MATASITVNAQESRRIRTDRGWTILPPEGRGNVWRGSAQPDSHRDRMATAEEAGAVHSAPTDSAS